jgi:hypothetical protein
MLAVRPATPVRRLVVADAAPLPDVHQSFLGTGPGGLGTNLGWVCRRSAHSYRGEPARRAELVLRRRGKGGTDCSGYTEL